MANERYCNIVLIFCVFCAHACMCEKYVQKNRSMCIFFYLKGPKASSYPKWLRKQKKTFFLYFAHMCCMHCHRRNMYLDQEKKWVLHPLRMHGGQLLGATCIQPGFFYSHPVDCAHTPCTCRSKKVCIYNCTTFYLPPCGPFCGEK